MKTTIIAVLLAFASITSAQDKDPQAAWLERNQSCGFNNGHAWNADVSTAQLSYIIGVMEAESLAGNIPPKATAHYTYGFNVGEHQEALTRFFSDSANGRIAIVSALLVVRMQFEGKPYADIDTFVRYLRSFYAPGSKCGAQEAQPSTKPNVRY